MKLTLPGSCSQVFAVVIYSIQWCSIGDAQLVSLVVSVQMMKYVVVLR